jgi:UDP-N-acetyl-D-galactosamine dehydrogenase
MQNKIIAVVGLGYVGLPLVVEFGKLCPTIGFDIDLAKVSKCRLGSDPSRELTDEQMSAACHATYTSNPQELARADIFIIAVPTPVDDGHVPDFRPLVSASISVGRHMKLGAIVIYESTVYPGATEEVCLPVLERESGMTWKTDFFLGYSPERINPGDREHTLTKVVKIVSGDTAHTLETVAAIYELIVEPGVFRASSIRAAEAAKVIENTQRDLNIALMNELAMIFNHIGLDSTEVLEAAGTKWNFLKFRPGLVGGHCIGVDPYYLTYKAEMMGYYPQVILAGRRINDGMGKFIAEQTIKQLIAIGSSIKGAAVNVLGFTFKEDCSDLRNSKVIDVIRELQAYGINVFVSDPAADNTEAEHEYGVNLMPIDQLPKADAVVVAVAHREYSKFRVTDIQRILIAGGLLVDVKACLSKDDFENAGYQVWRL